MTAEELFGPDGLLARVEPKFEFRPQQQRMADAVLEALGRNSGLVVEAGTGVGKSLAYLLPGALWAATGREPASAPDDQGPEAPPEPGMRRLLVSTHTRALQEQIMERELPTAARALKHLGRRLRYAMLMGADNYLCIRRLERLCQSPAVSEVPPAPSGRISLRTAPELFSDSSALMLEEIARWAKRAQSGHRSYLPHLVPQSLWRRICRDPELCPEKGRFCSRCLYRQDRDRAERAHVLVVNHALLLSGGRLPPCDAMVIDEAHTFPETAAAHFGAAVSSGRFWRLCDESSALARRLAAGRKEIRSAGACGTPATVGAAGGDAEGALAETERAAARCAEESLGFLRGIALQHGFSEGAAEPGGRLLDGEVERIEPESLPALEASLTEVLGLCPDAEDELEVRALQSRAAALRKDLHDILQERSLDTARWVEWYPIGAAYAARPDAPRTFGFELRAWPFDVAERLAERMLGRKLPVIMTSATLSAGRGLGEFKAQAGFLGARELVLDSPFDFRDQAALLVVEDLPEPSDEPGYAEAVAERCLDIIPRIPGGVFLLFSSWKMLHRVHGLIRSRVQGRPLWVQGAAGNEALLSDFIAAGNAVLLGVDTFWQGVDVPGSALSCVVLAKLPFPNFASPLEAARRRWHESLGRSYFESWSLPRAVMKLRQGFGRLIRTATDRGAVVLLDPRVLRKRYGEAFLEALPVCRRLSAIPELSEFFGPLPRKKKRRRKQRGA
ncbi:MAG: ATP-dependent DNA helicase [Elusimicrobiota bacterium]|jgi:ATP-dependent DNA helicase DinG